MAVVSVVIVPISCFNLSIKTEEKREDMLTLVVEKGLKLCVNNLRGRRQPLNYPISPRNSHMMTWADLRSSQTLRVIGSRA